MKNNKDNKRSILMKIALLTTGDNDQIPANISSYSSEVTNITPGVNYGKLKIFLQTFEQNANASPDLSRIDLVIFNFNEKLFSSNSYFNVNNNLKNIQLDLSPYATTRTLINLTWSSAYSSSPSLQFIGLTYKFVSLDDYYNFINIFDNAMHIELDNLNPDMYSLPAKRCTVTSLQICGDSCAWYQNLASDKEKKAAEKEEETKKAAEEAKRVAEEAKKAAEEAIMFGDVYYQIANAKATAAANDARAAENAATLAAALASYAADEARAVTKRCSGEIITQKGIFTDPILVKRTVPFILNGIKSNAIYYEIYADTINIT